MLKKKTPFLLISLGAAFLLIGGGIAAYLLIGKRHFSLGDSLEGSQLIPQNALLTASISTDTTQWQQLQRYGTPETQAAFNKQLTGLQENLLRENGYDYDLDIKPWLGKTVMISYLSSGSMITGKSSLPDIIVLPIEKPDKAQQLLAKVKSQTNWQFVERSYKGIDIRETKKGNSQNYSVAVIGRFVVVTNNPKTMDRIIDIYKVEAKGEGSIAATPGYSQALRKIDTKTPLFQFYLNLPVLSAVVAENSKRQLSPTDAAAKQQMQGIAAKATLEPEGILFQGVSWLKPDSSEKYQVENATSRLPRRLPGDTLLMVSGGNLAWLWQDYARNASSNSLALISPDTLSESLKSILGVDLETNLLPWMGGDFSLALIPASPEALTNPENQRLQLAAGVVLMVQASDRSRAEQTLQQINKIMESRHRFQVEEIKVKNQPVVNWKSPLGGVSITHGWLDGNVLFVTLGAPITADFLPQPKAALTQNQLFQQAVPTQPNPNNGQFFLDVENTLNSTTLNFSQLLQPEQKMWAKAIKAIGITSATSDKKSNRFDLFLQLKTITLPNISPSTQPNVTIPSNPSLSPTLPPTTNKPSVSKTPQTSVINPSVSPTLNTPQTPVINPSVSPTPKTPQTPLTPLP
jgi:hypothetical protein